MVIFLLALIIITVFVGHLVLLFVSSAIMFARGALALLIAFVMSNNLKLVGSSSLLNFVACAAICFGVVALLSTLPRVDLALKFLCTMVISVFIIEIVALLLGSLFIKGFQISALFEIIMKVGCLGMSVWGLITQARKPKSDSSSNKMLFNLERLLASFLYSVVISLLYIPINGKWPFSEIVFIIVLAVGIIGTFLLDIFLDRKNFFDYNPETETVMPK